MYEFGRFFSLIKHKGLPMYLGDQIITPFSIVWWWPINWFVFIAALIISTFSREQQNDHHRTD